jgi:hypothetical protein
MADNYPTGKAQQMVADALGIKVNDYTDANEKFANIGLVVSAKRVAGNYTHKNLIQSCNRHTRKRPHSSKCR